MNCRLAILTLAICGAVSPAQEIQSTGRGSSGSPCSKLGQWNIFDTQIINPTAEPIQGLLLHQLKSKTSVQFARPVWLPPFSRQRVWQPVRVPLLEELITKDAKGARSVELESILVETSGGADRQIHRQTGVLRTNQAADVVGLWMSSPEPQTLDLVSKLVAGWSSSAELSVPEKNRKTFSGHPQLERVGGGNSPPPTAQGLNAFNLILLTDTHEPLESGPREALRQWLWSGGKLWIQADRVDSQVISELLPEYWSCQVLGVAQRSEWRLADPQREGRTQTWTTPEPQRMVLLSPGDLQVSQTASGWPLLLRRNVGAGQLLVTTLDMKAWRVEASAAVKPPPAPVQPKSKGKKTPPPPPPLPEARELASLTSATGQLLHLPAPEIPSLLPLVEHQVSYKTISRQMILVTLGTLSLGVLVCGLYFRRRGIQEYSGLSSVTLALGGSLVLIGAGMALRRSVPASLITQQWMENGQTRGLSLLYSPTALETVLRLPAGVACWPNLSQQQGQIIRLLWSDRNRQEIQRLRIPSGSPITLDLTAAPPSLPSVHLKLLASGLEAQWTAPPELGQCQELLLTSSLGTLAFHPTSNPSWQARAADLLAPGQFADTAVLSPTQVQHQSYLRQLSSYWRQEPRLLAWYSQGSTSRPEGIEGFLPAESTLASLPFQIDAAAPGTAMRIPAALMRVSPAGANQKANSLLNAFNGQWLGRTSSGVTAFVRFEIPKALLPLRMERATLRVNLSAPDRTLEILAPPEAHPVVLAKIVGPIGAVQVDLPPEAQLDAQGGIVVGVRVNNLPDALRSWTFDGMSLEVQGRVENP